MTIASETNRVSYAGNGVTTLFNFNAPYRAATDFEVILRTNATGAEAVQALTTHYTIAGVANANTGGFDSMQLTMLTAPPTGTTLVINRKVAPTSSLDPAPGAALTAPNLEGIIDRLCLAVQNVQEQLNRAVLLPKTSPLANEYLPDPAVNLGAFLRFNAAGDGVEAVAVADLSGTPVSMFAGQLLDDADAATARNTLEIVECIVIAVSDETTPLTTGTPKVTFRMPYAFTLTALPRASLTTASSGAAVQVDINEAGGSILSTPLTIDTSQKTSTTAATPAVLSDSALADDAEITIDVDVAGTNAAGLKVYLIGRRT